MQITFTISRDAILRLYLVLDLLYVIQMCRSLCIWFYWSPLFARYMISVCVYVECYGF